MNCITQDIPGCHAYIDDKVVYSSTFEKQIDQLRLLFQKLDKGKLTIDLGKCAFGQDTVEYLGHIVRGGSKTSG